MAMIRRSCLWRHDVRHPPRRRKTSEGFPGRCHPGGEAFRQGRERAAAVAVGDRAGGRREILRRRQRGFGQGDSSGGGPFPQGPRVQEEAHQAIPADEGAPSDLCRAADRRDRRIIGGRGPCGPLKPQRRQGTLRSPETPAWHTKKVRVLLATAAIPILSYSGSSPSPAKG